MPEITPSEVIANIERAIAEGTVPPPQEEKPKGAGLLTEYPEPDDPRHLFKTLERGPLLEMREREAVDRPAGTGLLHRIFARITRHVAVPQARYNHHSRQAIEITAGDVDILRTRLYWDVRGIYEKIASEVQILNRQMDKDREWLNKVYDEQQALSARLETKLDSLRAGYSDLQVKQRSDRDKLETLEAELGKAFGQIAERATWAEHEKVWSQIGSLSASVAERASAADLGNAFGVLDNLAKAVEERASQRDVATAFEQLESLNEAVHERASQADMATAFEQLESLNKAVHERASQADVATAFEQLASLNRAMQERASLEETARLAASIADEVGAVWRGIEERDRQIAQDTSAIQSLHNQTARLQTELKELRSKLLTLDEQLRWAEEKLRTAARGAVSAPAPAAVSCPPSAPATGATDPDIQRKLDLAYLAFQRLFRGDENELRARLGRYQSILREAIGKELPRVLDVACGDGIFLEVLGEQGWDVSGVDINEPMVRIAQQRGIPVERADAVTYLETEGGGNYDAITALQFVEHLPPDVLFRFLTAAYGRLQPGGVLLVETINPHTLKALHWFHLDLSHARLVYPEMLQLLCETAGFREISWRGINPVEPHERLGQPAHPGDQGNVDRLNALLYGDQDYYLVARRPSR